MRKVTATIPIPAKMEMASHACQDLRRGQGRQIGGGHGRSPIPAKASARCLMVWPALPNTQQCDANGPAQAGHRWRTRLSILVHLAVPGIGWCRRSLAHLGTRVLLRQYQALRTRHRKHTRGSGPGENAWPSPGPTSLSLLAIPALKLATGGSSKIADNASIR